MIKVNLNKKEYEKFIDLWKTNFKDIPFNDFCNMIMKVGSMIMKVGINIKTGLLDEGIIKLNKMEVIK